MITLGIDTSADLASVAIIDGDSTLAACEADRSLFHAETISSLLLQCLDKSGRKWSEVTLVGAVTGPGSFTGLRIGLSFVMGLCFGSGLQAVGLSSLEVMAFAAGIKKGKIRPVMDARRNEVFTALFEENGRGWIRLEADRIEKTENLAMIQKDKGQSVMIGHSSGSLPGGLKRICPLGVSAALLARRYEAQAIPAGLLRPQYLRPSAAEEKQAGKGKAIPHPGLPFAKGKVMELEGIHIQEKV